MPRELQNQPAGASLSVMFSRTQLAGSRLRIVARQINHLCRGSLSYLTILFFQKGTLTAGL